MEGCVPNGLGFCDACARVWCAQEAQLNEALAEPPDPELTQTLRNSVEQRFGGKSPSSRERELIEENLHLREANRRLQAERPALERDKLVVQLRERLKELEARAEAEMLRVKACEHIAEGDEGWERLRNECPSTMVVAALRDRFVVSEAARRTIEKAAQDMVDLYASEAAAAGRARIELERELTAAHTVLDKVGIPRVSKLIAGTAADEQEVKLWNRIAWLRDERNNLRKELTEANQRAEMALRALEFSDAERLKLLEATRTRSVAYAMNMGALDDAGIPRHDGGAVTYGADDRIRMLMRRAETAERALILQELVGVLYTPEEAERWLSSPHPMLSGQSAADLIKCGKVDDVRRVIAQLRDGAFV